MEDMIIWIKALIAVVGGGIAYWLGGIDSLLTALIVSMILDYISGILKAVYNKTLSSEIGFKGIAKKILKLTIVALAFLIEDMTGAALPLREVCIMFFVANEGISILENCAATGIGIPQKFKDVLEQLKGD